MTDTRPLSYTLVQDSAAFADAIDVMAAAPRLGIDTEADSRHHYPEKVCLIQVAAGHRVFIVDPLSSLDVGLMRGVMEDRAIAKVFHGADFDLRGLNRDWGFEVIGVYDTNVAARFAGLERFGYAALIEDLLGIVIPKDQRLQRQDWSKRPLSGEALEYAASDVAYLGEVRDALDRRLADLGRLEWVREEFERMEQIRYVPPDPETAFLSVRGSHTLDGKGLAVLKPLFDFRETEARQLNRPTAFVIPADAMIYLSKHPDGELADVPGVGASTIRRLGAGIRKAVHAGIAAEPFRRPPQPRSFRPRPNAQQNARLKRLKEWRAVEGTRLELDPALLWPMRSLERLARKPATIGDELDSSDVRAWQRAEFEAGLRSALAKG